ncbi:MAG: hypothetical protein HY901_27340 [Deltaproteobacteria bacterium]|nr:hypothetical protein [Deltaproteobacteria bacterium]
MTTPAQPTLEPGRVYRTRDLAAWGANAPRLAKRLVRDGALLPLAHGLFVYPKRGRFGVVPPTDEEVMRAFLDGGRFLFTGPERWNALGLGTTAVFASTLVYNTKRSGSFELGGRRFLLRRVAFPDQPTPEWYVVDLLENAERAGASRADIALALRRAVRAGAFEHERLRAMARQYGTRATQATIAECLKADA